MREESKKFPSKTQNNHILNRRVQEISPRKHKKMSIVPCAPSWTLVIKKCKKVHKIERLFLKITSGI